jgi:hypothetical protein
MPCPLMEETGVKCEECETVASQTVCSDRLADYYTKRAERQLAWLVNDRWP